VSPHPETVALIALAGATFSISAHHASFWFMRRSEALHGWVALWAFVAFLQQVGRVAHYSSESSGAAVDALRFSMGAVVLCGAVAPFAIRSLSGEHRHSWVLWALAPLHLLMLWLNLGSDLVYSSTTRLFMDAGGREFLWVDPGPLIAIWFPYATLLVGYCIWVVLRSTRLSRTERRVLSGVFLAYVALGVNDQLIALELIDSVLVFDYSFAIIVIGFAWLAAHRLELLHAGLEEQVTGRTTQLQAALDKAQTASAAKARFLANITHEIRTPLHGLQATTELLEEGATDTDQQRLAAIATRSTQELRRLVEDILDTSALETGELALRSTSVDARRVLEDAVAAWQSKAQAAGSELLLDLMPGPCPVLADELRLRQVLGNLLSNAIKHAAQQPVTVSLRGVDGRCRFTVADSGPGLDDAARQRVFDAFHQEAGTTGGTGLGLTIARGLVQSMGGRMDVDSHRERGSAFWFELPAAPAAAVRDGEPFKGTGVVLVADDHPVNREIVRVALARQGIAVDEAVDGFAAVARAVQGGLDLILMDIWMPGLDGIDAIRRIRSGRSTAAKVPIVAMTASTDVSEHQRCLDAGAQEVLMKPLHLSTLRRVASEYLSGTSGPPVSDSLVADLRQMFSDDAIRRLDGLGSEPDSEAVRAAIHAIKGAAGMVGETAIVSMCEDLEQSPDEPRARLDALREAVIGG
jgi:signal transduction histidine kinase/CheY-like chemotaxis protein